MKIYWPMKTLYLNEGGIFMGNRQTATNRKKEKTNGNGSNVALPSVVKEDQGTAREIPDELAKEIEWREKAVAKVFREGRNRGGRPTKLTELVIRDAEILARIGLSERAIAESLMIDQGTLLNWLKKSPEFFNRLKKARNEGKAKLVNSIYGHGQKNWMAHAWILERMYREEFALDKQKIELTGASSGPITFSVVYVDKKEGV
jgi:hypothetical protein